MAVAKLERQLALIAELLETERPLSAVQIQERLGSYPEDHESFKRAFERDKADLRQMGLPVTVATIPGSVPPEDGYRIDPDEYAFPDPGLDGEELAALQLAAMAVRLEGTDASAGLRKLRGLGGLADPTPGVAGTRPAHEVPVVVIAGAPQVGEIFDAVAKRCQLRFRYRDNDRVVDPARLRHERGHWYLQAYDHGAAAARSFRLDRIDGRITVDGPGSAEVQLDRSALPPELSAWSLGEDEPIPATVRVRPPQARLAARAVGDRATVTWEDDGSVLVGLDVRHADGFRSFVLSFLDAAEVLEPASLRADMVAWLQAIADRPDTPVTEGDS